MDQYGSQMPSFAGNGERAPQRPQSQPQSQSQQTAGLAKAPAGAPPKPHPNGVADVKPRLTKEQHDVLETHFQQQHKPSTSTKKNFAESLGVPLDKINNWFQNRRAKVKQDMKKQMNQYNMSIGLYGPTQMPMSNPQFQPAQEPSHSQPPTMVQDLYPPVSATADISPTCHPVQSIEGPPALDLATQIPLHPSFDMSSLRSIPEADRTAYHPTAVMQSFMAATAGASYLHSQSVSQPSQEPGFSYGANGFAGTFPHDIAFSLPNGLPNDPIPSQDAYDGFPDFSTFECSTFNATNPSNSADVQNSTGSQSSEPSPFSGAQSSATTQSSIGPNASSVTSIASVYSGWTDEQRTDSKLASANGCEDIFDAPYSLPQASVSDHTLSFWGPNGQNQGFSSTDIYQHTNASAQAILSSTENPEDRKLSIGTSDFETPPAFGDDVYSRRNSSTTNLANNIEAIHLQNRQTPDGFKHPNQPSSIAARRQKRPTALNPSTLRSSSYSGSMPSPGGNNEHTLRRIRSSGIPNAAGRVQKATPGSAQRSPMASTFAEAAASPKFARTFSSSSTATVGQGGSLAPPTPLTPNGFPYWQSSTVIRNHAPMPEHSSPESLNVNWSVEPQSAGLHSSGTSPPRTPLDLGHLNQARLTSEALYRDTPPQSAPATQQAFPRTTLMHPPHMRSGHHSTTDLTLAQPKPSHFRRPSLPDAGYAAMDDPPLDETQMHLPLQFGDMYDQRFGDLSLNGIHHNVPFAPPAVMPEFLVHEFHHSSAAGPGTLMRRTTEPQPRSYIFANQGPGDFR